METTLGMESSAAAGARMNCTSHSNTAMSQCTEMSTSSAASSAPSDRARKRSKYFMCLTISERVQRKSFDSPTLSSWTWIKIMSGCFSFAFFAAASSLFRFAAAAAAAARASASCASARASCALLAPASSVVEPLRQISAVAHHANKSGVPEPHWHLLEARSEQPGLAR
jgi:hypothetical protein